MKEILVWLQFLFDILSDIFWILLPCGIWLSLFDCDIEDSEYWTQQHFISNNWNWSDFHSNDIRCWIELDIEPNPQVRQVTENRKLITHWTLSRLFFVQIITVSFRKLKQRWVKIRFHKISSKWKHHQMSRS